MSLIPNTGQNLIETVNANDKNTIAVYNEGVIAFDSAASTSHDQNSVIHNAPGGRIEVTGQYNCSRCNQTFNTSVELEDHSRTHR